MSSIANILVVGSGIMGRGIAYVSALGGFQTYVYDVSEEALEKAKEIISDYIEKGLARGVISGQDAEKIRKRIVYVTELADTCTMVDFVIEAVPENMSIKREVFEKLDQLTRPHVILATNTSTMSPTEIGSYTQRPDKVIAMHFFNPVPNMRLVEIVTSQTVKQVAEKMGKETVIINEFPGFITSRINCLIGNEAFQMLMEGVGTPEEIDKAIELGLNFPMGPFKLVDLVGLDTRLKNLEYLHQTLGERFRPNPLLVKYVKAGRLGRKTGIGVYDYRGEQQKK